MNETEGFDSQKLALADFLGLDLQKDERRISTFLRAIKEKKEGEPWDPIFLETDYHSPNTEVPPIRLRLIPNYSLPTKAKPKEYQITVTSGDSISSDLEVDEINHVTEQLQSIVNVKCVSNARIMK